MPQLRPDVAQLSQREHDFAVLNSMRPLRLHVTDSQKAASEAASETLDDGFEFLDFLDREAELAPTHYIDSRGNKRNLSIFPQEADYMTNEHGSMDFGHWYTEGTGERSRQRFWPLCHECGCCKPPAVSDIDLSCDRCLNPDPWY